MKTGRIRDAATTAAHARVRGRLCWRLSNLLEHWEFQVYVWTPIRIGGGEIELVDLAVTPSKPPGSALVEPPFVAIDVLTASATFGEVRARTCRLSAWGVRNIWLADPFERELLETTPNGFRQVPALELPEYGLRITPDDVL